jgi:hypothetical protein
VRRAFPSFAPLNTNMLPTYTGRTRLGYEEEGASLGKHTSWESVQLLRTQSTFVSVQAATVTFVNGEVQQAAEVHQGQLQTNRDCPFRDAREA